MQHPDEGTIHAWLDESDALSPRERAELAEHVAGCPQCREAVAEARGMIAGASRIVAALDVVRGDVISGSNPQSRAAGLRRPIWRVLRLTPARAALAATVMIAVAIWQGQRARGSEGQRPGVPPVPGRAGTAATTDTASAAAAPAAATPAPAPSSPAASGRAGTVARSAAKKGVVQTAQTTVKREKVAAVERARVDSIDKPLVAVATTGAQSPAPAGVGGVAPAAAPSAPFDTSRNRLQRAAMTTRRATEAAAAPRQLESRVLDLRQANVGMGPPFTGCYEIVNDSGVSAPQFPQRFWLQRAAPESHIGPLRNVARALGPDGRVDASIPEGTWRAISATAAEVSWPSTGQAALTISFAPATVTGEMATANGVRHTEIRRIGCPL